MMVHDELNSKLRLRPTPDVPNLPGRAGTKSADSCGSLVSNDSFLCTTNTASPTMASGDSATPSTHESHAIVGASSTSPVSSNLAGMHHKLAVSRQRKRRPPTRTESGDTEESDERLETSTMTPLNMGCTQFFASSGPAIPLPFSHSPMDLISEEGSETDAKTVHTPSSKVACSSTLHSEMVQNDKTSPTAAPRPSVKSVVWPKRNASVPESDKPVATNRPVSMFVPPSATTPIQLERHQHQHQRSSPGPQADTEKPFSALGPKKPPRVKSLSTSEQPNEPDSPSSPSRTELNVELNWEGDHSAVSTRTDDQISNPHSSASMDRRASNESHSP
ncbi:unnamed protein product [Echinostoma caproni]|uniref:Uncharacterized protein n=1 Tax=Echinostoma caproni TaxID=27848 RepID=A0A183B7H3_9TREM|nr:unnamed protein product [Echinostoma caproni]